MIAFQNMTARVGVWNIAGFLNITDERASNQIEGLAMLDAEFMTLVEVKPFSHMQRLIDGLAAKGCAYRSAI